MANSRGSASARYRDTVRIESQDGGSFDLFTSFSLANDITTPSEASFECGNDGSWIKLENDIGLGKPFKVFVNDRLRMTGRVEMNDIPIDASSGSSIRFTVRTVMADAMYASANPNVRIKSTTLKDFILYLWKPLGITENNFVFKADLARDLMTGITSDGTKPTIELEELNEESAKVNPPETVYQACDRHLSRHGLMMWDSPDGKIVIGTPDDAQQPIYHFKMFNDSRRNMNNIISATRTKDWSGVPALIGVFGTGGKQEWTKATVRAFSRQQDILDAGLYRPVLIINEGVKTDAFAQRQVNREMTSRSMRLDTWTIKVDGLSYWDGGNRIPYGVDTVCDIVSTLAGGPCGAYLIHRVQMTRNVSDGDTTELTLLKRGIWSL